MVVARPFLLRVNGWRVVGWIQIHSFIESARRPCMCFGRASQKESNAGRGPPSKLLCDTTKKAAEREGEQAVI